MAEYPYFQDSIERLGKKLALAIEARRDNVAGNQPGASWASRTETIRKLAIALKSVCDASMAVNEP